LLSLSNIHPSCYVAHCSKRNQSFALLHYSGGGKGSKKLFSKNGKKYDRNHTCRVPPSFFPPMVGSYRQISTNPSAIWAAFGSRDPSLANITFPISPSVASLRRQGDLHNSESNQSRDRSLVTNDLGYQGKPRHRGSYNLISFKIGLNVSCHNIQRSFTDVSGIDYFVNPRRQP